MRVRLSVLYIITIFILSVTDVYGQNPDNNQGTGIVTHIQYDDETGYITNTHSVNLRNGNPANNLLGLPAITPEQLQELKELEELLKDGPVPDGYATWDEFKTAMMGKMLRGELPDGYNSWQEYKEALLNTVNLRNMPAGNSISAIKMKAQEALLVLPTAVQASGYLNQLNSYDEAFHNTDMHMMMPYKDRIAYRFANQYAVVENYDYLPAAYKPNIIYSSVARKGGNNGIWFRPYTSTGSINFKNGPKVDNTLYGAFIGYDSTFKHLSHSDFQYSVYAGYNGSHQSNGDNTVNSQGGLLGVTGNWYGENAFASLTVNAGATNAKLETSFTNKDYPIFATGVAGKTGYNFEFADGKFIIQPNYMMSYSFVTPFENGSIKGIEINSKPMNVLNISPGIKFIGNFEHGLQPYAEARMVWNLFDKSDYSTAYVEIPSISIKPYAQYGIGIRKLWGERSTGYIQFMMRSGGRNDIAFSAGYKCDLGE